MKTAATFCYRARIRFAVLYNTGSWWKQQLAYLPWLILTAAGNVFYGLHAIRAANRV